MAIGGIDPTAPVVVRTSSALSAVAERSARIEACTRCVPKLGRRSRLPLRFCAHVFALLCVFVCVCVCEQQSSRSIRNDLAEYYHPEPSSSRLQLPQLFGSNARPRPPTPVKNRKRRRE